MRRLRPWKPRLGSISPRRKCSSQAQKPLKAKRFQVILAIENVGIGAANHEIAEQARKTGDIILTFDEDFPPHQARNQGYYKSTLH